MIVIIDVVCNIVLAHDELRHVSLSMKCVMMEKIMTGTDKLIVEMMRVLLHLTAILMRSVMMGKIMIGMGLLTVMTQIVMNENDVNEQEIFNLYC